MKYLYFFQIMSELQCFKRQSINKKVTFDIIIKIQNKSKECDIKDYVINISPSVNCSIYQLTIKCNELDKETKYEIKIIKFNYSNKYKLFKCSSVDQIFSLKFRLNYWNSYLCYYSTFFKQYRTIFGCHQELNPGPLV